MFAPLRRRRAAVTPAGRVKRVLGIEIESGGRCGGKLRIIARISFFFRTPARPYSSGVSTFGENAIGMVYRKFSSL